MSGRFCILPSCNGETCISMAHTNGKGCAYRYDPADYPPELQWKGEGDPPRRWRAPDGTLVYRTFADYCD